MKKTCYHCLYFLVEWEIAGKMRLVKVSDMREHYHRFTGNVPTPEEWNL